MFRGLACHPEMIRCQPFEIGGVADEEAMFFHEMSFERRGGGRGCERRGCKRRGDLHQKIMSCRRMYSPARGHVELIAPRGGIRQELFKREGKALPMAKNISCGFDGKPVHRPGHFVFADGPDLLLMPQDKTDAQPGNAAALRE